MITDGLDAGDRSSVADFVDIGDLWSGVTDARAASYRSGSQGLILGWCYTGADCEGRRGRHTGCLDVHNAGRCCYATTGRCAGYVVLPMISDGMDIGDVWSGIAFTSAAGYRTVCQDLIRG